MKVVIVGSGLIGVTSAYRLARRGYEVIVLDRAEGPARETSFANGAMLTPGMAEPWNSPSAWLTLLGSFFSADAALRVRPEALPSLVGWGLRFLMNCRAATVERNAASLLQLALFSRAEMDVLRGETKLEYGRSAHGSLNIFRHAEDLDRAAFVAAQRSARGLSFRRLSRAETIELEPGLAPIAETLAGALHYQTDEVGDARRFCEALAEKARALGVAFHFGVEIVSIDAADAAAVSSDGRRWSGDRLVIAAGSYSAPLLRSAGIDLPVRPAKGYSLTLADDERKPALRLPIIDHETHTCVVPLQGAVRIVGFAEFAGYDCRLEAVRLDTLKTQFRALLPNASLDVERGEPWCGLRPSSPDGVAIIGVTRAPRVWVNSGHGHLGWTTAAGSAQLLASLLSGDVPAIDPAPYAPSRFAA